MLSTTKLGTWQMPGRKAQVILVSILISFLGTYYISSRKGLSYPSLNGFKFSESYSTSPIFDPRKVAFIVETRPLPHLPALFTHMQAVIPPEWSFKFMGSPAALDFMRGSPIIRRLEESGKLEFLPVPDNYSVTDRQGLSTMFTDIHLYRDILAPAEHLLVWQPDSIMCANAPTTVNDFLEYDYVGAPWGSNAEFGGNGGLSLRRVSKILDVLVTKTRSIGNGALEDLWLSTRLKEMPGAVNANGSISKTFSVETVWDDHPLGYHVGWLGAHHGQIWDVPAQIDHIMNYCPEIKMILGMKLERDKPQGIP